MVFLSTDAGGVGLNLQSGSFLINMDIPWNPAVLEQRIGRVHRLGQHRTVRVINFVTSASIEERILDLLKFKKSLFTGALDSDGEDVVMVGESQMKRLMQSVDKITKGLEKGDPAVERQQQIEAELDNERADIKEIAIEVDKTIAVKKVDGRVVEPLHNLLASGAQFLMDLSKIISRPGQTVEGHLNTMIDRDDKTGNTYLKIPLPEMDVVRNIFSALSELLPNMLQRTKT
jgi:superfamily II DNA/RNA helicase